jgi:hypothetical protein
MALPHRKSPSRWNGWIAAALVLSVAVASSQVDAQSEFHIAPDHVDNLKDLFARIGSCWRVPARASALIDITVLVAFDRGGNILGKPKITYESEQATDNDRVLYRIAVMEALQRCTPMPFTEGMAGASAGRPVTILFKNRKPPPQPTEKRVWLSQKIL